MLLTNPFNLKIGNILLDYIKYFLGLENKSEIFLQPVYIAEMGMEFLMSQI